MNLDQTIGKPRVLVLTDIENEPDDAMSLVRFLTI
ncbi:nucleoside hydrolase-like domain-containing protein [Paenibacillus puerhi]|nr:nucleoside hydrolase-like domain-containing protein [Paenibacillus puerhi]